MHNIHSADQRQGTEGLNSMLVLLDIIDKHECLLTASNIIGKVSGNGVRIGS